MNNSKNEIYQKGYTKGKEKILNDIELNNLNKILVDIKTKETKDTVLSDNISINLLGKNSELDKIIEKILTNESLKKNLECILGEKYVLRADCVARFSNSDDDGMYIHQDGYGETSLTFLVTNQENGTTAVVPGTHLLVPFKKARIAEKLSWSSPKLQKLTKYFLKPLKGFAGEYHIWFNRIFHGRLKSIKDNQISLIFSFWPLAYPENEQLSQMLKNALNKINYNNINSNYLKNLVSDEVFVKNYNEFKNSSLKEKTPVGLSLYSFLNFLKFPSTYLIALSKCLILELICWPIYFLRLYRKIKSKI